VGSLCGRGEEGRVEIAEQSDRVPDLAARRAARLATSLAAQSQPHDRLLEDALNPAMMGVRYVYTCESSCYDYR
jgi:hypothetical protein